ncbi:MAG: LOG family protein [Acidimicrobiia bacterium]|nr:LOG family protein [Acidimicrobiia bacterium]
MTVVAVFGASTTPPDSTEWGQANRCGRLLAEAGYAVATGGYGGTMEAVSEGAASVGGDVIGVTAPSVFPDRPGANTHVTHEVPAASLTERIGLLVESTDASIALPGSLGTATEVLVAWNAAYVAAEAGGFPKPLVAVGDPWFELVRHLERLLGITPGMVSLVPSVDEAVAVVSLHLR